MSGIFERLSAPFDPAVISWRPGSTNKDKTKAKALAYLDARDVMRRLDEVCGPANWGNRYIPMPNGTTCCEIKIRVNGEWLEPKSNGAGNTDIEAEKGGYSDAFKRAAVLWGIGRYLYDIDSPWVRINQYKQIEADELPRLSALLKGEKPKSAYQARKDGDWPELANRLRECRSFDQINDFLAGHQDQIYRMPDSWRKRWDELVEQVRDSVRGSMAA